MGRRRGRGGFKEIIHTVDVREVREPSMRERERYRHGECIDGEGMLEKCGWEKG